LEVIYGDIMSIQVVEWLLERLKLAEKANNEAIKDFIFRNLVNMYGLVGSANMCQDLEQKLKETLKDEDRAKKLKDYIESLIKVYNDWENSKKKRERVEKEELLVYT